MALTLENAMSLYHILGRYIPEIEEEDEQDVLQFVGKIVSNIRQGSHRDYVDAVMLMSGKSWDEIKEMESEQVLGLFIDGLAKNKIVQLKSFCDSVGFSHA
jgi:hypothetical protein